MTERNNLRCPQAKEDFVLEHSVEKAGTINVKPKSKHVTKEFYQIRHAHKENAN